MSKNKIQKFFDEYSKNLSNLRKIDGFSMNPDFADVFVCPICFGAFSKVAIEKNLLSLEHIPPENAGGAIRTLTCKTCNNEAGSKLDSQLKKLLEYMQFWHNIPGAELETKFAIEDSSHIPATLKQQANNFVIIEVHPHRANPKDIENVTRNLNKQYEAGFKFDFQFRPYKDRAPEAALLRIAYLYAFSVFGYGLLANSNLDFVRKQIQHPTESVLPIWGIAYEPDLPDEMLGINLITEPEELRSFCVAFELVTSLGNKSRWIVLLPGPSDPGLNIYQWWTEHVGSVVQQKVIPIGENSIFRDDPLAVYEVWNEWT